MTENQTQNVTEEIHYAGFNIRLLAQIIDTILLTIFFIPMGYIFPAANKTVPPEVMEAMHQHNQGTLPPEQLNSILAPYFLNDLLPNILAVAFLQLIIVGVIFVIFWKKKGTTPGKAILKLKVVDADTLQNPSMMQSFIRFIGYLVCMLTLMFGFMLVMFNKRRRGLHDIMANTLVIYDMKFNPEFEKKKFKYQTYFFLTILLFMAIYLATR